MDESLLLPLICLVLTIPILAFFAVLWALLGQLAEEITEI